MLDGHDGLRRATWEWGFETGSHALRLVFGGMLTCSPRARIALGHLGETLPYLLWRFDSRAKLYRVALKKRPSDYIRQNIVVTTSGMCSPEPLNCALAALGTDRVMFAADDPFDSAQEAGAVPGRSTARAGVCARTSRSAMPPRASDCRPLKRKAPAYRLGAPREKRSAPSIQRPAIARQCGQDGCFNKKILDRAARGRDCCLP